MKSGSQTETIRTFLVLLLLVCGAGLLLPSDAGAVTLSVSSASGEPGETVEICVDMATEGDEVAGVQADMVWNPECAEINVTSCSPGDHDKPLHKSQRSNSRLRAILLALDNVDPIPDGSRLFCCDFRLLEGADAGPCRVTLQNVSTSDSVGNPAHTGSYAGAIMRPSSSSASGDASEPMQWGAEKTSIEDKVVSGGAPSQEAVVAVGGADTGQAATAPAGGAPLGAEVLGDMAQVEQLAAEPLVPERQEVRPAVEAPGTSFPSAKREVEAEVATKATVAATPAATAKATEEAPKATLTASKATVTAGTKQAERTPAKAKAAVVEKEKDESACQISARSSGAGTILLLLGGGALGVLRRRNH